MQKSDYKYFIRYNDVYDIKIRPLQLKIDNFILKYVKMQTII